MLIIFDALIKIAMRMYSTHMYIIHEYSQDIIQLVSVVLSFVFSILYMLDHLIIKEICILWRTYLMTIVLSNQLILSKLKQ